MRLVHRQLIRYLSAVARRPEADRHAETITEQRILTRLRPFAVLFARVAMLVGLFVLLEKSVRAAGDLPEEYYFQPFLFVELVERAVRSAGWWLLLFIPIGLTAGVLLVRVPSFRRGLVRLWHSWSDLEHSPVLRVFIGFVAFIAAWAFSTYDYNLYFDQSHYADRLLLLLLAGLLCWRPVFVFPFLLLLVTIIAQFNHPIGSFSWSEPILLVRVLVLFGAAFLIRLLTGHLRSADFLFVLCCLIASHYWVSGFGKLQLGWFMQDHIYYLLPATYANGWLGFMEPETVAALTRRLSWLNGPMKAGTLLIECGALVSLWRRGLFRGFLVAWIALHLGIFFVTGICFWKWMVLDAAVWFVFFRRNSPRIPIFTRNHFLLALILIGGGARWFRPVELAWYDTRASYTYRFEAHGESGAVYALPPSFFAPYDYQFTLSNFGYLTRQPHLYIVWGATQQRAVANALVHATSPGDVWALEAEFGATTFDPRRSATFNNFLQRFVGDWNRRTSRSAWWAWLQAPPQLWTFPRSVSFRAREQIQRVVVYQVTSLYDGEHVADIRKRAVREIDTSAPTSSANDTGRGERSVRSSEPEGK